MSYLDEMFGLSGRTAVVTGGSSGIGRAMAVALGRAGARVVLVARRAAELESAVAELAGDRVDASFVTADLADRSAVARLVSRLAGVGGERGGGQGGTGGDGPDILVNAAGVNRRPPMPALTVDDWDVTLAANLTAPFLLGQAFAPGMAARGWGRIINVVSQQAFRAYGNSGAYGVSKGGLVALTRSQAEAWSRYGVLCNAVAPGVVRTPLTEAVFADPDTVSAHAARTMIGRNGLPSDFGACAVFLASDANAAMTGQTLFVDGGYSAT